MRAISDRWLAAILTCILCVVAGCGYNFAGKGVLPGRIDTVFVSVFENNSSLLGIESDFTGSMIEEITRRRGNSLVDEDEAEAVFSGVIRSISTSTATHRDKYTATSRRVWVTLSVRLVSRDGHTLWTADRIRGNEVYTVESEKYATDQNLRSAVRKLADDLATRIYNQMTANF